MRLEEGLKIGLTPQSSQDKGNSLDVSMGRVKEEATGTPYAQSRPRATAAMPVAGQHGHSDCRRETLMASKHLSAPSELETCPGTGRSGEPEGTTNNQTPGRVDPGISKGTATEGPRGVNLNMTPPAQNLMSRYTQGHWERTRAAKGASVGHIQGKNLPKRAH